MPAAPPFRARRTAWAGSGVGLWLTALLLCGCTAGAPAPTSPPTSAWSTSSAAATAPPPASGTADAAAAALAAGLAQKDVSTVEFAGSTSAEVQALLQPLVAGMGPLTPTVTPGAVTVTDQAATADLAYSWTFPGVAKPWTYTAQAALQNEGGQWKTSWLPSVLHPQLDGSNRLTQHRLHPTRGRLLGEDGDPIVKGRAVFRIGIDKSALKTAQAKASAARLARLVGINVKRYVALVTAAGPDAFVEAIVYRAGSNDRPASGKVRAIPGGLALEDSEPLAPTRDFARATIGTVGPATKEIVDASKGAIVGGDDVGLSGLQQRYDAQLRGTPGAQVQLVAAKPAGSSTSPSPSTASPADPVTLFEVKALAGKPLTTTLNVGLQKLAEQTLAGTKPAAALVAVRPSTGELVAVANGPGSGGQPIATVGQYAPGSTFKVISALALLRAGLDPSSRVTCPPTVDVDGKTFKNYSDYPSSQLGTIDLRTALAQSCNTAFIGQRGKLQGGDLADAAASLGVGIDYDVGYPSFFGSVPTDVGATTRAAGMIGQGQDEASPMAMAAVVASVAGGRTVVPRLIEGTKVTPKAAPLTKTETEQLRAMMRAVVTSGSGRGLAELSGPTVIAKTGTAEYGAKAPYKTHAWMIAAQGDLAVAVFVQDGASGSQTAGPLLRKFLQGAR